MEHEVLDDDGCILIADDEDRVFRIVGCSAPGMYDIMSAGTRRAYYYGSDSVELIKDYMPRCYATVMTGYLTPLQSRFEVGKIAELTEDFIIKDKVHEGYLTIEAGTPVRIHSIPRDGMYEAYIGWKQADGGFTPSEDYYSVPDALLKLAGQAYPQMSAQPQDAPGDAPAASED